MVKYTFYIEIKEVQAKPENEDICKLHFENVTNVVFFKYVRKSLS